jgi:integrase
LAAFDQVRRQPAVPLHAVVTFAYITGWRIDSEVLPLEWRQVDWAAGEVVLDPQTTKNGQARVFPMTNDPRAVLRARQPVRDTILASGRLCPWVFFRLVATQRGGAAKASPAVPKIITRFSKAWANACAAAQVPGRIPHDFRRTAIRDMVRRGVPERVAMQLTGHNTRSVSSNIVSRGDLKSAATQLRGLTGTIGWRLAQPRRRHVENTE